MEPSSPVNNSWTVTNVRNEQDLFDQIGSRLFVKLCECHPGAWTFQKETNETVSVGMYRKRLIKSVNLDTLQTEYADCLFRSSFIIKKDRLDEGLAVLQSFSTRSRKFKTRKDPFHLQGILHTSECPFRTMSSMQRLLCIIEA